MSDFAVAPEKLSDLKQIVADLPCVLPVGNRTKEPLAHCEGANLVSLSKIRGIIEYEPSEFTFTAWAGTPLSEIREALDERRQYLPFDPVLADAGATLGGTISAGLSGPGRFRFGGVRDFLLGVKLLGGDGNLIQGGGKVVKNAAGFDIPKFLVGSLGRYGMMVEASFKVFPKPDSLLTLSVRCESHEQAMQRISELGRSRWEPDAIDYRPQDKQLFVRIGGPRDSVLAIAEQIRSHWNGGDRLSEESASRLWKETTELSWSGPGMPLVVKVPTTSESFLKMQHRIENETGISVHLSAAANVAWIAAATQQDVDNLNQTLESLGMAGLVIRGACDTPRIGDWPTNQMQQAIKKAMDPDAKYAGLT